jgi:hypothetical protein
MRIDQMNCAGEAPAAQIFQDRAAGRSAARTATDHGDGARRKQPVETIGRHVPSGPMPSGQWRRNQIKHIARAHTRNAAFKRHCCRCSATDLCQLKASGALVRARRIRAAP